MVYERKRKLRTGSNFFIHLEDEKTQESICGYGVDGYIRLKDERGNVWSGSVERGPDDQLYYRLKDGAGRFMTGLASAYSSVFRDERGNTWKGFLE
jgi:hypothetical protein